MGIVLQCVTDFKDCFGLDQSQVRLYHAIARHTVLVMTALAICAVTAACLRDRTDTQAPPPARPDQPPPADPGMIPLTVPEITRLLTAPPAKPGHAEHWSNWRRRHQARARWYHQRTRLARDSHIAWAADPCRPRSWPQAIAAGYRPAAGTARAAASLR